MSTIATRGTYGRRALLAATVALGVAAAGGSARAATVSLIETGSSLLYPLFNLWVPAYRQVAPDVQITTQSTGSGTGISQSVSGIVQIGASDAYLSDALMKKNAGMLNIPLAISSQMVNYNLPGLNGSHLKLSGPVLAGIYAGKITKWNDPAIAKLNPGTSLPDHQIVTVHRSDGSGDTFIFTQFLSDTTPSWQNNVSYGTTISWPAVQGGIGTEGNPGMVNALKNNQYAIAYIGVSFKGAIDQAGLGEAMLQNASGKFVLPTVENVAAAAKAKSGDTPADERISLINASGDDSYPIINYEYAIVKQQQADANVASALRAFLSWATDPSKGSASSFLQQVSFVPLPDAVAKLSAAQIAKIQ